MVQRVLLRSSRCCGLRLICQWVSSLPNTWNGEWLFTSPFFDEQFYLKRCLEASNAVAEGTCISGFEYYMTFASEKDLFVSPTPLFDASYYSKRYKKKVEESKNEVDDKNIFKDFIDRGFCSGKIGSAFHERIYFNIRETVTNDHIEKCLGIARTLSSEWARASLSQYILKHLSRNKRSQESDVEHLNKWIERALIGRRHCYKVLDNSKKGGYLK